MRRTQERTKTEVVEVYDCDICGGPCRTEYRVYRCALCRRDFCSECKGAPFRYEDSLQDRPAMTCKACESVSAPFRERLKAARQHFEAVEELIHSEWLAMSEAQSVTKETNQC